MFYCLWSNARLFLAHSPSPNLHSSLTFSPSLSVGGWTAFLLPALPFYLSPSDSQTWFLLQSTGVRMSIKDQTHSTLSTIQLFSALESPHPSEVNKCHIPLSLLFLNFIYLIQPNFWKLPNSSTQKNVFQEIIRFLHFGHCDARISSSFLLCAPGWMFKEKNDEET